jgi:hypothetical protein
MARQTAARARRPMQIVPGAPPRLVRYKSNGMVTSWSTLFNKELQNIEPYYRPGTTDREEHIMAMRRYEAQRALRSGDPFLGGDLGGSAFGPDTGMFPDAAELDA